MRRMGFRQGRDIRLTKREARPAPFAIRVCHCALHLAVAASLFYLMSAYSMPRGPNPGHPCFQASMYVPR